MYIPEHFRMSEADLTDFMSKLGAATLVSLDAATARPMASYLPWAWDGQDRLTSHIGRVNPQSSHSGQSLVILMGLDAYVSEEWMEHLDAPSWNYETVHLYGQLTTHTDLEWILRSWDDMLKRFSKRRLEDYDRAWLEKQALASVGVEFQIEEIQAKSKLSQNRSEADVRSIGRQLESRCPGLAERMTAVSLPHVLARQQRVSQATAYLPNS